MKNERGLVGNFVDSCEFNWLDPKEGLSVLGHFMDLCKTNRLHPSRTASLIADFTDLCETNSLKLDEALRVLNAQDWDADDEESVTIPVLTVHEDCL